MHRFICTLALVTSLGGCIIGGDDDDKFCNNGKCDGAEDRCEAEHAYNNGICDTDCAQADIDCFLLFDDQPAANGWFTELEKTIAMQEVRQPRATLPVTDPHFTRMRALLDRGWESYRKVMPVGLIDRAPELVVIDDPTPNAFVARDQARNKAAWVVMVQTGAMEGQADHALLGVVMHELTHAIKLHIMDGVPERTRIHYQIKIDQPEPIGNAQNDNGRAREAITAWRTLGEEAGAYAYAELNGLPVPGSLLSTLLNAAISKVDTSQCTETATNINALQTFLNTHMNPLTSLVELPGPSDRSDLDQLTRTFLTELRNGCLATLQIDLFVLMAEHFNVTEAEIDAKFPASERAMVAGKHIVDQITILASDRHRRMRDVAMLLQEQTNRDITTLRYFSTEEAADDATIPVLRDMGLPATGVAEFFQILLPEGTRGICDDLIASSTTPPYGDLVDEHHATCWRIAHVHQLADLTERGQAYGAPRVEPAAPSTGAYRALAGERLPRFPRASDYTSKALHR